MANYKSLFMSYLDNNNIKYSEPRELAVKIVYKGDNLNSIPVWVFFDEDGDPLVSFKCWDITNFKGDKVATGILSCNELNSKYRWIKFYVDDDGDVIAETDAYIDSNSCGETCHYLVRRMVSIIDKAYPTLMKAQWS